MGHKWFTLPSNIKNGAWCPECCANKKKTLDYVIELAGKAGGKCLSNKYYNQRTRMTWQCAKGHIWETPAKEHCTICNS